MSERIAATRIILWRHGRSVWNTQHRFQGQADPPLDDSGRDQARAAAAWVAELEPDAIVSSDLVRCVDTAAELAALTGLPVARDPRLREISVGTWEGLTREEVAERHPEEYAAWTAGWTGRRGGGESRAEVAERAFAALTEVDATAPVLVTHSVTANALACRLLGLPDGAWVFAPLGNCRWAELRVGYGGWRLYAYNQGPAAPRAVPVEAVPAGEPSALDAEAASLAYPGTAASS